MQATKTTHYDWFLLNNRDISEKYMITLRNKFAAFHEISETFTPKDEYVNFVNVYMKATEECIPIKLRAKHRYRYRYEYIKAKQGLVIKM